MVQYVTVLYVTVNAINEAIMLSFDSDQVHY